MRNLIFAINTTLDGCCDHTKTIAEEELLEDYMLLLRDADLLVYGRKTYQLMVPYWPDVAKDPSSTKADKGFAQTFVSKRRLFFHDHWPALKMEIRKLFVRTFATKYLN
jgi:hypothetical protein